MGEFYEYWKEHIGSVSNANKIKIIQTISQSFYLEGKKENPRFTEETDMVKFNESLLNTITCLLNPTHPIHEKKEKEKEKQQTSNIEEENMLLQAIIDGVSNFIRHSIMKESLLPNLLQILEQSIETHPNHNFKVRMVECLSLILNRFPSQVDTFIVNSTNTKKITSSYFFLSLLQTFKNSIEEWIKIIPIEKM